MTDSSDERHPVEALAEEFVERQRRGERPSLHEYTAKYPHLADDIRDLFPALVIIEQVRPQTGDATGAYGQKVGDGATRLERLGDYRILHEVGRGGMGVVYEAEQESLGRHVAVKVLAAHALLDTRQVRRFQREARAVARLHHTNIVPIYGVGEHAGLHYYVMQFIRGLGLDEVLAELKRFRPAKGKTVEESPAPATVRARDVFAVDVAQGLLTGRFQLEAVGEERPARTNGQPLAMNAPPTSGSGSSCTVHLPGQSEGSTMSQSVQQFWQSVGRIGVQVAEALAYANSQGTLHRDIKPSNLLLDTQGTVWVTDFGLAKATDGDDLTHTGDIVGTLRYMAPERFQGQADARSDIYSLGLTLYELITLQPAFNESDRHKLIHQVTHEEPPPPRKLNPLVPRDLETIVLKAIARDPAHRYQTATELADDLNRFLDYKPIRARRVSQVERLWRWCGRNPVVASLLATLLLVFLGGFAAVTWKWREAEQAREDEQHARAEGDKARQAAVKAQGLADARAAQSRRELQELAKANRLISEAEVHRENGLWEKAEAAASRAVHLRPDLPSLWMARAELYTQHCLWDLAAADFARAYALQEAMGSLAWYEHALLRLAMGDDAGYRRVCKRMDEAFHDTKDNEASHRLALACVLVPDPVMEAGRLIQIAGAAGPDSQNGYDHLTLALAHYRAGHYDLALRSTQKCAALYPNWEVCWRCSIEAMIRHRLGQAAAGRQLLTDAKAALDQWIAFLVRNKGGQLPTSWWYLLMVPRFYAEAQALIEGAPAAEDPRWWAIRGRGLAAVGRVQQAKRAFARAVAAQPKDADIWMASFHFHADQRQWERAAASLARGAKLRPKDPQVWMDGFQNYAAKKYWKGAEVALARAADLQPVDPRPWLEGFRVYASNGNWARARAAHARAVSLKSDSPALYLHVCFYHAGRSEWDQAEAEYARVRAQRPNDPGILLQYGNYLLNNTRRYQQAAAEYARATKLVPGPARALPWNQLGICYYRLAKWDKAIAALTQAVNAKPKTPLHWKNRASCYVELDRWPEAAADYGKVVELEPVDIANHRAYAFSLLRADRTASYRGVCSRMVKEFGQVSLGNVAGVLPYTCTLGPNALADFGEVFRLLAKFESTNASNPVYLSYLGRTYYRAGQFAKAVGSLHKAEGRDAKADPVNCFFLALAYHHLGNTVAARQHLANGVRLVDQAAKATAPGTAEGRQAGGWEDRVAVQLLRREAEGILNAPHRRQAEECFRKKQWQEAIGHFDQLIKADGAFWPDRLGRGSCHAELGQWAKAEVDYAKAVELGHLKWGTVICYVLVILAQDDVEGYRRVCAELLERHGQTKDSHLAGSLAGITKLVPNAVADQDRVVQLAEKAVKAYPKDTFWLSHYADVLFRAGRHKDALERLQEAERLVMQRGEKEGSFWNWIWLALVHHHLGHPAQARKYLDQTVRYLDQEEAKRKATGKCALDWAERLELRLLRREAEALIRGKAANAKKR